MSDLTENKSHKRVLRFKKTALKDTLSSQPEENGGLNEPLVGEEVAIPFKRKKYSAKKKSDENVSNLFASSLSGLSDNEDTIEDNSLITQIYNDYSKEGDNSSDDLSIAEEEKGKEDKLETKSASDGAYEKKEEVKELEKIDEKVEDEKSSLDAQEEQFKHNYSSNRQNIQNNRSNNRQNSQNSRYSNRNNSQVRNSQSQQVEEEIDPNAPVLLINDLNGLELPMLREKAKDSGLPIEEVMDMKRQEIIVAIAKDHAAKGGSLNARGTLEVLQDGYGFLRSELNSYITGPEDIFTSPQLIRQYGLRTGDEILAHLKTPKQNERYFAVAKILSVNNDSPLKSRGRVPFDALTPVFPDELINMETVQKDDDVSMRLVNLFDPIGKGQRALITAPPRTGKTILLKKIANSITTNYPNIKLMVLLIDERPEEVTDMERSVKGEVIASTFDEQASRHVAVAEMVIEKAKRMVEYKQDVVILLDSITRLARAYNQTAPASGKVLSGGVDSNALHKPKRFFGAARNIENGGSLTIIASALIETGSRMDEVIFEEFKGTGNCELVLDRKLAEKRVFPALNLKKSGTRRDDLLLKKDEIDKIQLLRDSLSQAPKVQIDETFMTELVIDEMHKYNSNEEFFVGMMRESQIK